MGPYRQPVVFSRTVLIVPLIRLQPATTRNGAVQNSLPTYLSREASPLLGRWRLVRIRLNLSVERVPWVVDSAAVRLAVTFPPPS